MMANGRITKADADIEELFFCAVYWIYYSVYSSKKYF